MKHITVREIMSRIVSHHRAPLVIEATFQLHHKFAYSISLQLKADTCGVFVVEETAEFDGSQRLPPE